MGCLVGAIATIWLSFSGIIAILTAPPSMKVLFDVSAGKRMTPAKPAVALFQYPYEMKALSFALTDRRGVRTAYAQFAIVLDCPSEEARREIELRHAFILDLIQTVAGQFFVEDFATPKGLHSFKAAMLSSLRTHLRRNAPRSIAVRDWLIN